MKAPAMSQPPTIKCMKCQAELPTEARFCTQCGAPVVLAGNADSKVTFVQNILLVTIAFLLAVLVYQGA